MKRLWIIFIGLLLLTQETQSLRILSPAFGQSGQIPRKYTCDGEDVNPPLHIEGIPAGTKSFALIVDDPDAPMGIWAHWVVWNIDNVTKTIDEDSVPGVQGMNDFNKKSYGGPCPPSGTHRYFFKLFALDDRLNLEENSTKADLENAMEGHILARARLIGYYKRKK